MLIIYDLNRTCKHGSPGTVNRTTEIECFIQWPFASVVTTATDGPYIQNFEFYKLKLQMRKHETK